MGKTILVSSHILPELASICNRIGIIERSFLLACGEVTEIMQQVRQHRVIEIEVLDGAEKARSNVECDALLINDTSRTDTYPYIEIEDNSANVGHEATVSKIGDEQLFYLMSRGLSEEEAMAMIVRGFIEPIAKELPLEYAVELNRLIELQMEGAIG